MRESVWVIITNKKNEYLLLRRSKNVRNGNLWNFPGGNIDKGEKAEVAGRRECKEEIGVDPGNLKAIDSLVLSNKKEKKKLYFVKAKNNFDKKIKINKESDSFKWVAAKDLKDLKLHNPTKQYFLKILNKKKLVFSSRLLFSNLYQTIIGKIDDKIVASADICLPTRKLHNVRVEAGYRGNGYANKLMTYIMSLEARPISLVAKADQDSAIATPQLVDFYKKFGFETDSVHRLSVKMKLKE